MIGLLAVILRVSGDAAEGQSIYLLVVVAFLLWPLAAAGLATLFGLGVNFGRYMIIYNWVSLPLFALNLLPAALFAVSAELAGVTLLVIWILIGYFSWRLARVGLGASIPVAIAFMLADLTLGQVLDAII